MKPVRGHRNSGTQKVTTSPHPIVPAGKPRPVAVVSTSCLPRSKPISTVSGSVFPAPVSLFGDLCLGHREGQLSQLPLGGARPAIEPGGGSRLCHPAWGRMGIYNFRGICNKWGDALGTWWLWAILGGKMGGGLSAVSDSALSVGTERTHDGQGRPT